MKNELSDEQVDKFLRQLVNDASASDEMVSQITDSPSLWWSVQREIRQSDNAAVLPWPPPVARYWRWLAGAAVAAAAIIGSLVVSSPWQSGNNTVATNAPGQEMVAPPIQRNGSEIVVPDLPTATEPTKQRAGTKTARAVVPAKRPQSNPVNAKVTEKHEEIKTDFISLTYAQNPASGQVVRVKVPSAMMVDLGVVPHVDKPTSLVDAEVVVGDDGMTHAIRFIRGF